jgi:hypothetical protein
VILQSQRLGTLCEIALLQGGSSHSDANIQASPLHIASVEVREIRATAISPWLAAAAGLAFGSVSCFRFLGQWRSGDPLNGRHADHANVPFYKELFRQ